MADADMAGPVFFALVLGTCLLFVRAARLLACGESVCGHAPPNSSDPPCAQTGKVHFGYIYGFGLLGSLAICGIVNLMAEAAHSIDVMRTFSILGYSLLPVVVLAAVAVFFDLRGTAGACARARGDVSSGTGSGGAGDGRAPATEWCN